MVQAFNEIVKPKITAAGALRIDGLEWLTGDQAGVFTGASQWESLHDGFAALEAFYADPEVVASFEAHPVEFVARPVGIVLSSVGDTVGDFMGITTFSLTAPDIDRFNALLESAIAEASQYGIKGAQSLRLLAAGAGTGLFVVAAAMDNIDAFPQASAATSESNASEYAAMGATIVDRLIVRVH